MTQWLGVWRRIGIRPEGFTHLVVERDELWEVWPHQVFCEGDAGPERKYVLRERAPMLWEIDVAHPYGMSAGLLALEGDRLRITLGIDERRPANLDDAELGRRLDVYEREADEATTAKLAAPVPRVPRIVRAHPVFGELRFQPNLDWWSARVAGVFSNLGEASIEVSLALEEGASDEALDDAVRIIEKIDLAAALSKASEDLLQTHNSAWRNWSDGKEEHEGPVLDAAQFEARLTLTGVTLEDDGRVELWFDDGDLFWGHDVRVGLDEDLVADEATLEG
jgi:hypothetical protein